MELDTRTKTEPDVGASEQNSLLLGHAREQIQTPAVVLPPKRAPVVESISEKEAYEEFSRIWDVLETDFVEYVLIRVNMPTKYATVNHHSRYKE